jgi:hypothetical protein
VNVSILKFGAEPGTLCTPSIQRSIDACYESGGGEVSVPAGEFITGSLRLKSRVILHLESGASLRGSLDPADYTVGITGKNLIVCENAVRAGITGPGEIHARGSEFYDLTRNHPDIDFDRSRTRQGEGFMPDDAFQEHGPAKHRDRLGMSVCFYHCSGLILRDFVFRDAPHWAFCISFCDDVQIRGLSILNNLLVPNSDGIHCTSSRNVRISDCDIRAGDDAVVVTGFPLGKEAASMDTSSDRPGNVSGVVENCVVTNCLLQSRSSGIRIGYGTCPIRGCVFSNLRIYGSNRGIGIYSRNGGGIEDVIFSDIVIECFLLNGRWWGQGEPIHISAVPEEAGVPAGEIRNVRFHHILAGGGQGIVLYGREDSKLRDIGFDHVRLRIESGPETLASGGNFDLRPADDPREQLFAHEVPGVFARHVHGLDLHHVRLWWGDGLPEFFTHGLQCESVDDLHLFQNDLPPNPSSPEAKTHCFDDTRMRD